MNQSDYDHIIELFELINEREEYKIKLDRLYGYKKTAKYEFHCPYCQVYVENNKVVFLRFHPVVLLDEYMEKISKFDKLAVIAFQGVEFTRYDISNHLSKLKNLKWIVLERSYTKDLMIPNFRKSDDPSISYRLHLLYFAEPPAFLKDENFSEVYFRSVTIRYPVRSNQSIRKVIEFNGTLYKDDRITESSKRLYEKLDDLFDRSWKIPLR